MSSKLKLLLLALGHGLDSSAHVASVAWTDMISLCLPASTHIRDQSWMRHNIRQRA